MCSRIQCVLKKRTKKKGEVSEREREKKKNFHLQYPSIAGERRRKLTQPGERREHQKYWWGE
jgi:hypothetical protein